MPSAQIKYPAGVYGFSADVPIVSLLVDTSQVSATTTAGNVVIVDTATPATVKPAATNSAPNLVVGVALANGVPSTTGGPVTEIPICVYGRCQALIATTVTAGNLLGLDSSNAAFLMALTAGLTAATAGTLGTVIATAEESIATNTTTLCRVRVAKV